MHLSKALNPINWFRDKPMHLIEFPPETDEEAQNQIIKIKFDGFRVMTKLAGLPIEERIDYLKKVTSDW